MVVDDECINTYRVIDYPKMDEFVNFLIPKGEEKDEYDCVANLKRFSSSDILKLEIGSGKKCIADVVVYPTSLRKRLNQWVLSLAIASGQWYDPESLVGIKMTTTLVDLKNLAERIKLVPSNQGRVSENIRDKENGLSIVCWVDGPFVVTRTLQRICHFEMLRYELLTDITNCVLKKFEKTTNPIIHRYSVFSSSRSDTQPGVYTGRALITPVSIDTRRGYSTVVYKMVQSPREPSCKS